ncbi:MAG: DNA recombination protein RmuC [Actinobacteria bacterium HGW-Actinobacteria-4]|nr:MAG: DNA recombination protein RmuC [Actinobacteria bacterium HGW-Actinobacteria-4]
MMELVVGAAALVVGTALGYFWHGSRHSADADSQLRTDLALERARAAALEERVAETIARAKETEESLRVQHDRYVDQVRADQDALKEQFKALAGDVLKSNNEQFLEVASERLKRAEEANVAELAKREESVKNLVEPMAKALAEVQRQTTEADKFRAQSEAKLSEQVKQLMDASTLVGKETAGLKNALRRPEVRGRWGELHLQRVVEVAGLVNRVDFVEQVSGVDDEGRRLRPDMLVRLAGGRTIVVDAKTSIDAILDLENDGTDRAEVLSRHADSVRKRVTELKSKAYTSQFDSPVEFTILFMPAESFLQLALEHDPRIQEWAYEQGVVIATPTILVALLRTVAHAWKEDTLAKNARDVLVTGKELYERLTKMGDHLARVGKAIDSAGKAYNDTIGALERRVLPSARRFGQLQEIEAEFAPTMIETEVRQIAAPELTSRLDD